MRIPRIFTDQCLSSGAVIELEEDPSRHLAKVLRMQTGRELILFNGQGGEYQARIETVNKKAVSVAIGEFDKSDRQSHLDIELAIGTFFDLVNKFYKNSVIKRAFRGQ